MQPSARVRALHEEILAAPREVCAERALVVTRFFRDEADPNEPLVVQKARALAAILGRKEVRIHTRERLVGCFTSHRVGGGLYPELHGVVMLEDLFRFERRRVNPLLISPEDRKRLLVEVLPYWATRVMVLRGRPLHRAVRFVGDQLAPTRYLVNESGGISHFVPDYAGLLARGTSGMRRAIDERRSTARDEEAALLEAMRIACDGMDAFAEGYRGEARRSAVREPSPERRHELEQIADACAQVPVDPPRTFHEALQAILFWQIALNLESLDNSISPGRLDQVLWPYYLRDIEEGRIDREEAFELLGCFALKLCEVVPVFSRRITRFHGGLFNGQVVVVGGTDREGRDATNALSFLFLELMDALRTRQPNYHARLHLGSPLAFRRRIAEALADGAASPAVYNDEVIVPLLAGRGIAEADARDYANVGCVEPVAAGKSLLSTDAALVNLPLCLELALNGGRRFGRRRQVGPATPEGDALRSMDDVVEAFRRQMQASLDALLEDLRAVEEANMRFHPTPLSSLALGGCLESARDATAGGARYNGSGVQGVGVVDVGDSLAALETVVFGPEARASLGDVVRACRADFASQETLRARLACAPKYGNDDAAADRWTGAVMKMFSAALEQRTNARGGRYAAGFYSVTAHQAFGEIVGALPSGRRAGAPFASGLSPASGADQRGATAALASYAALPLACAQNGVNYNLELTPWDGAPCIQALVEGGFAAGAMQLQVNVLDPSVLRDARQHPDRYRGLLVRVSGYSAYFTDLSPEMQQEIIDRWSATAG